MAEYNNQSINIDLEEMFNGLSNKGQEEFLIDMFSNLYDEDSRYNVVNDNMLYLEYDTAADIIINTFESMDSYNKKDIAERIVDALTSEQREEIIQHIKEG
nr:MAG TPA: hypothetical protein [Caudoviricetes sp.]